MASIQYAKLCFLVLSDSQSKSLTNQRSLLVATLLAVFFIYFALLGKTLPNHPLHNIRILPAPIIRTSQTDVWSQINFLTHGLARQELVYVIASWPVKKKKKRKPHGASVLQLKHQSTSEQMITASKNADHRATFFSHLYLLKRRLFFFLLFKRVFTVKKIKRERER